MKEWFFSLNERERVMVAGGAVLSVILLFYGLIWNPVVNGAEQRQAELSAARKLTADMKEAVVEAKRLQSRGGTPGLRPGQSLLSLVDSTVKRAGLNDQVDRVKPQGQTEVQIWLDNAPFDKMITWLETLQSRHGVVVKSTNIDRAQADGTVKASIELSGAG